MQLPYPLSPTFLAWDCISAMACSGQALEMWSCHRQQVNTIVHNGLCRRCTSTVRGLKPPRVPGKDGCKTLQDILLLGMYYNCRASLAVSGTRICPDFYYLSTTHAGPTWSLLCSLMESFKLFQVYIRAHPPPPHLLAHSFTQPLPLSQNSTTFSRYLSCTAIHTITKLQATLGMSHPFVHVFPGMVTAPPAKATSAPVAVAAWTPVFFRWLERRLQHAACQALRN